VIEWRGHTIDFIPVLSHRTLWLATMNELWLDGKLAATSGGFGFRSRAKASLEHEGETVTVLVESSTGISGLECEVIVDGQTIMRGVVKARRCW
jgi:hypothetical protein